MAGLLWGLVILLIALWAIGFFFANLGNIIHIVLVIAAVVLIWNLISGSRARV